LNGALGGDFFTIPPPQVNAAASNSGTISVAFDTANVGQLSTSDYVMRHDGANFILTKVPENSVQTLVGGGPFNIDGLTINLATAPAANDEYLIQPTKFIPRAMQLVTTDPSRLAIASPVRSTAALANISEAQVSRPEVLDSTNPALLTTTQVVFNDPPSTFQINGAGPLIAYSSDADIDVNGWRIQIGGVPDAGDTFTVMSNAGGSGDNTNGLALAQLQFASILAGGTASYQEAFGLAVGEIGAVAQQTRISHGALSTVRENTLQARNAISGVNLDEEAANLLRFQQAFEAAAQVIAAADATFESLINATRG
jgi:flagellar hook-associated protein 1 FlgK